MYEVNNKIIIDDNIDFIYDESIIPEITFIQNYKNDKNNLYHKLCINFILNSNINKMDNINMFMNVKIFINNNVLLPINMNISNENDFYYISCNSGKTFDKQYLEFYISNENFINNNLQIKLDYSYMDNNISNRKIKFLINTNQEIKDASIMQQLIFGLYFNEFYECIDLLKYYFSYETININKSFKIIDLIKYDEKYVWNIPSKIYFGSKLIEDFKNRIKSNNIKVVDIFFDNKEPNKKYYKLDNNLEYTYFNNKISIATKTQIINDVVTIIKNNDLSNIGLIINKKDLSKTVNYIIDINGYELRIDNKIIYEKITELEFKKSEFYYNLFVEYKYDEIKNEFIINENF